MTSQPQNPASENPIFRMRIVPWWTDACSTFLGNVFKWLPTYLSRTPVALEFGGGNSTLYLLARGSKVVTIESDESYIKFIHQSAASSGYKSICILAGEFNSMLLESHHLVIIKTASYGDVAKLIPDHQWDFIVNDGIARREVLESIHSNGTNSIIILDNVEYCANWGRLDRTSAKPDLTKVYRGILRDSNWRHYIFEQPEGRDGRGSPDKTGWESPHRWASAVLWPASHIFNRFMITNIGLPVVNDMGLDDADTETLKDRCPFDWTEMRWLKAPFPPEMDLKLFRNYD